MSTLVSVLRELAHYMPRTANAIALQQRLESVCESRRERRRAPRQELELVLTATAANGTTYRGFSRDISDSGMAALIWGHLRVGEQVVLSWRVSQPGSEVQLPVIVRHRTGFRYGFEFAACREEPAFAIVNQNVPDAVVAEATPV